MYRRILVPLDGTRFSEQALPAAISLAAHTGSVLELVHVHHHHELDPGLAGMPQYRYQNIELADARHDDQARERERGYLEAMASELELRYGIEVRSRVLRGPTAEAICREAEDVVADMVVIASHARQGLQRLREGSLAHDLVCRLNVPAVCVHPQDTDRPLVAGNFNNILVPLDGSAFSEQVLDTVTPLAAALDATLTLLHVVGPAPLLATGFSDTVRVLPSRDQALAYLRELAGRLDRRLRRPELVAIDDPDSAFGITRLLQHGSYDMVAMATHGRSGLSRMLLGSVAEQVLARTSTPVLLYRPRLMRLPTEVLGDAFHVT